MRTRWLAQRLGLAGRSVAEQAAVDSLHEQLWCTLRNHGVSHDGTEYSVLSLKECDAAETVASTPRYQEIYRRDAASLPRAVRSLAALRVFEERLAASTSGWLVGWGLTYVDLALFEALDELAESDNVGPDFAVRFELPQLGAFFERVGSRPHIREYLRSPRRMPRYARDAATGAGLYVFVPGRDAWVPPGVASSS